MEEENITWGKDLVVTQALQVLRLCNDEIFSGRIYGNIQSDMTEHMQWVMALLLLHSIGNADVSPAERRAYLDKADTYLQLLRILLDEGIRDLLIGTRLAPYVAEEVAGFCPPVAEEMREEREGREDVIRDDLGHWSTTEQARIARWHRQVQEWPLSDACALVMRVLNESLTEAERRMTEYRGTPFAPTYEEQSVRAEYVASAVRWYGTVYYVLYAADLIGTRFAYYIEREYREATEAREREHQS